MICGAINLGFGGHGGNERRPAQNAKAPPRKAFMRIRTPFAVRAFPPLLVVAEVVARVAVAAEVDVGVTIALPDLLLDGDPIMSERATG
jgi:hypothetical protein